MPDNRIVNFSLIILSVFVVTASLIYTAPVVLPFTIAVFIYLACLPFLRFLENRRHWPHFLAASVNLMIFLLVSSLLMFFAVSLVQALAGSYMSYKERTFSLIASFLTLFADFGLVVESADIRREFAELPFMSMAQGFTGSVLSFIGYFVLVAIFVLFLFLGENRKPITNPTIREISTQISRYLVIKTIVSFFVGLLTWMILSSVGIDLAFMFGVLAFILNFIPNIGSVTATLLPLPIGLLQFGLGWEVVIAVVFPGILHFIIGNIIEPKLMGDSLDLHPITLLLFLVFWGLVWGIPGMFLSVPITSVMKIVFQRSTKTRFLSDLLSGRLPFDI